MHVRTIVRRGSAQASRTRSSSSSEKNRARRGSSVGVFFLAEELYETGVVLLVLRWGKARGFV